MICKHCGNSHQDITAPCGACQNKQQAEIAVLREKQGKHHKMLIRIGDHVDCALAKVDCTGMENDVKTALRDIHKLALQIAAELED